MVLGEWEGRGATCGTGRGGGDTWHWESDGATLGVLGGGDIWHWEIGMGDDIWRWESGRGGGGDTWLWKNGGGGGGGVRHMEL